MKMAFSIHPFLLAVYLLLFLYSNNLTAVSVTDLLLPLMLLLLFPALLWFLVSLVLKDNRKVGLIVSLFLFFFFSFGYFSRIMVPQLYQIVGSTIGPRTLFSILWGLLFMGSIYFLGKADKGLDQLNTFLNFFSAFMIILIVLTIGFRQARMVFFSRDTQEVIESPAGAMSWKDRQNLPNIFFIILDGYGRTDVLKERFQFDNKDFIDYLKHKGFFVAQKSHSNYCQTLLTLASILNLKYLNEQDGLNPQADSHFSLIRMIKKNQVVRLLKPYGYISVALIPDQKDLEFLNFDITIRNRFGLNEFQSALLEITPLYLLLNKFSKKQNPFQNHRKRILAMFDQLGEISRRINAPAFIYAHILIPHPPFVFGPHGEELVNTRGFSQSMWDGSAFYEAGGTYEEYLQNYKNQAIFASKKIQETLDQIFRNATRPTVILLQGDHGPGSRLDWRNPDKTDFKERFSILNAYYFPDHAADRYLYDSITPVNSFRIVLNLYIKQQFHLLRDESFFSTWDRPYKFIPVRHND